MLTQDRLHNLFNYNPETGIFTRRKTVAGSPARIGDPVGGIDKANGYMQLSVCGRAYHVHRLAWLYVYGTLPSRVSHINGDKLDNRIANLRAAGKAIKPIDDRGLRL